MNRLRRATTLAVLAVAALPLGSCKSTEDAATFATRECPPQSPLTWDNFGKPFADKYCATCHSQTKRGVERLNAPVGLNYDTVEDLRTHRRSIFAVAADENVAMPLGTDIPTPEERRKLGDWLACGAPEVACGQPGSESRPECADVGGQDGGVPGGNPDASEIPPIPDGGIIVDEDGGFDIAFPGNLLIERPADLARVRPITLVHGNVTIATGMLADVSLPNLRHVTGELRVSGNGGLVSLSMPALTRVGRDLWLTGNMALPNLDGIANLETVGGDLFIGYNPVLSRVTLDHLERVGGSLVVGAQFPDEPANPALTEVSFGVLTRVGEALQFRGNGALTTISVGGVTQVQRLYVIDNDVLPAFAIGALATIDNDLLVSDNAVLGAFDLPALMRLGGRLTIRDNPQLPTCAAQRVRVRAEQNGFRGEAAIEGNNDGGACEGFCMPVGATNGEGEVCTPAGRYEPPCVDATCLEMERLCQRNAGSQRFNACVEPQQITAAGCMNLPQRFGGNRQMGGPIVRDLTYAAAPARDAVCQASDVNTRGYVVTLSYSDPGDNAYPSASPEAQMALRWVRANQNPMAARVPLEFGEGSTSSAGSITMVLCLSDAPSLMAVQLVDIGGLRSNVACGSLP